MPIQFLHSGFLWALFALLLPIIIHLFNFKKHKKIYFSSLKLLENLQAEHKSHSQLKHLLILFARLLAITCIITAFAQPYIPVSQTSVKQKNEQELVSLYIDNSFSMNAEGEEGILLEVAKNQAFEIITEFPSDTRFQVISNSNFDPAQKLNKKQAISLIQDIVSTPATRKISEIIKQTSLFKTSQKEMHTLFIFSDFQKNNADFDKLKQDSAMQVILLPMKSQSVNNIFIDTCWFTNPYHKLEQTEELHVRIRNTSLENFYNIPIKLYINDSIRSISSFNIKSHSSQVVKLKYSNRQKEFYRGKIEISDFPITYDNYLYFSYRIAKQLNILCVNGNDSNPFLDKLYSDKKYFTYKNVSIKQVRNNQLQGQHLIILNEINGLDSGFEYDLINYIRKGGTILIIPNQKSAAKLKFFLKNNTFPTLQNLDSTITRFASVQLDASIYKNVFKKFDKDARLPDLFQYFEQQIPQNSLSEIIWEGRNKNPLLTKTGLGKGNLYLLSINLHLKWSNVVAHPIFIPTFLNMVLNQNGKTSIYQILTENNFINLSNGNINEKYSYHIQNEKLKTDVIPEQRNSLDKGVQLFLYQQIQKAQNYDIKQNEKTLGLVSFNYPRSESEQNFYSYEEINSLIKTLKLNNYSTTEPNTQNIVQSIEKQRTGKSLSEIFIILCLVFFVLEALLHNIKKISGKNLQKSL